MNHMTATDGFVNESQQESQGAEQTRLSISGEFGTLRAWLDGNHHQVTGEPTISVDVVYIDRETKTQRHLQQRGLRVTTVASMCACICLGEENVTSELIDRLNSQFSLTNLIP